MKGGKPCSKPPPSFKQMQEARRAGSRQMMNFPMGLIHQAQRGDVSTDAAAASQPAAKAKAAGRAPVKGPPVRKLSKDNVTFSAPSSSVRPPPKKKVKQTPSLFATKPKTGTAATRAVQALGGRTALTNLQSRPPPVKKPVAKKRKPSVQDEAIKKAIEKGTKSVEYSAGGGAGRNPPRSAPVPGLLKRMGFENRNAPTPTNAAASSSAGPATKKRPHSTVASTGNLTGSAPVKKRPGALQTNTSTTAGTAQRKRPGALQVQQNKSGSASPPSNGMQNSNDDVLDNDSFPSFRNILLKGLRMEIPRLPNQFKGPEDYYNRLRLVAMADLASKIKESEEKSVSRNSNSMAKIEVNRNISTKPYMQLNFQIQRDDINRRPIAATCSIKCRRDVMLRTRTRRDEPVFEVSSVISICHDGVHPQTKENGSPLRGVISDIENRDGDVCTLQVHMGPIFDKDWELVKLASNFWMRDVMYTAVNQRVYDIAKDQPRFDLLAEILPDDKTIKKAIDAASDLKPLPANCRHAEYWVVSADYPVTPVQMRSQPSADPQYRLNGLQLQHQQKLFVVEKKWLPVTETSASPRIDTGPEGFHMNGRVQDDSPTASPRDSTDLRLWLGFMHEGVLRWCPEKKVMNTGEEKVVAISCSTYRREREVKELANKTWKGEEVKYSYKPAPPDFDPNVQEYGQKLPALAQSLNTKQRQAVDEFLAHPRRLHLLQGPPGTGKSMVISTLLRMLMLLPATEGSVLVCAPTNQAVQILCTEFLKHCGRDYPCCYIGVARKMQFDGDGSFADDLTIHDVFAEKAHLAVTHRLQSILKQLADSRHTSSSLTHEERNALLTRLVRKFKATLNFLKIYAPKCYGALEADGKISLSQLEKLAGSPIPNQDDLYNVFGSIIKLISIAVRPKELEEQMIRTARVIFVTLDSAGRKHLRVLAGDGVRWCIVDEAGQSVEAQTLNVLAWQPRKLLLVGDPNQLSATVISAVAEKAGYGQSLMARMLHLRRPYLMLEEQYRMHPDICTFPNNNFYQGKLKNGANVRSYGRGPLASSFIVVDVEFGYEETGSMDSLLNQSEAHMIAETAKYLGERGGKTVALAFYNDQVRLLQDYARNIQFKAHSVDAFQGSEADTILLSCVRANADGKLGFLNDAKRVNVALTRAKKTLIVFANLSSLRASGGVWQTFVEDATKRKVVQSAHTFLKGSCVPYEHRRSESEILANEDDGVFSVSEDEDDENLLIDPNADIAQASGSNAPVKNADPGEPHVADPNDWAAYFQNQQSQIQAGKKRHEQFHQ